MSPSVFVLCKIPSPRCSRSSFSGTARSRRPIGANGLPCPSPSLWQTAGGRSGTMPVWSLLWRLTDSMTNCCSVCLWLSLSLTQYLCYSYFSGPPWYIFFSVFLPRISDMSNDPCGVRFHKCHSLTAIPLRRPFTVLSCLLTPKAKSIVIHSSQSLNMNYCNTIISHSSS